METERGMRSDSGEERAHAAGNEVSANTISLLSAEIDGIIERLGAQYVANLRALSGELARLIAAQMAVKDAQITQLGWRIEAASAQLASKEEQLTALRRRLEAAEWARETLVDRLQAIEQAGGHYATELRALSEELTRRAEAAERLRDALETHTEE